VPPAKQCADDVTAGEQIGRQGRYGLLLITLIAVYLLSALASGRPSQAAQLVLVVLVALIALRNTDFPYRNEARWAALGGSALAIALVASSDSSVARGIGSLWTGILLLATVVIIVGGVLKLDTVTAQSIYAALSAYLLIGLMFAAFFGAIDGLGGTDFFVNGEAANIRTYQYFSFTTLTTLGYGDFTAAGSFGRAVAVLEALTGQVFLATLVARLVSAYRGPARRDPTAGDSPDGPPPSDGGAAAHGGAPAHGGAAHGEAASASQPPGPGDHGVDGR
jgi:Ion channel